ncbi:cupin domain-containing protein [Leucobacter rhizosphaerae]|uniref:Cupin domain-containing protein n=1 Tax=Leucobacter rhizosphaerae TaxID=2932245 RepID=A0ABY4FSA6_9MICO|nr:cupin domain-containing protein [Leucobacter rhizosphaerae]UOQ59179.1 cupin domain-containing protein [Leucobacter rhizosphaerae]
MTAFPFDPVSRGDLATAVLGESANPARLISGTPEASELVLHEDATTEIGVWEITPGSFHSSKVGVSEFMYFLSGSGTITRESGEVVEITAGSFVSLPDGSHVVWDVTETSRKLYIITQTQA